MLRKTVNAAAIVAFCIWVAAFGFEILTASQKIPADQQRYGADATHGDAQAIKGNAPPLVQLHSEEKISNRKNKERQAAHSLKEFFIGFLEVKLTDLLIALFTIVLAVKTAGLFRETAGLRDAADKQRADSLRSIVATEIAAAAAGVQADVAKKALADIERPYLFVFNISGLKVEDVFDFEESETFTWMQIRYSVANYGKIPAIIKSVQAGLSVGSEPDAPPPVGQHHPLSVSPILTSSERRDDLSEGLRWDEFGTDEGGDRVPQFGDESNMFFWVIITYRGPFTSGHETRACWRYDQSAGRFIGPHGGPEYSGEK